MWRSTLLLVCLSGYCCAGPLGFKRNMPIMQREDEPMIMEPSGSDGVESERPAAAPEMMIMSTLTLPSNATSIRADITDGFSCENKTYGYYADVENDCQIFHVCLPVTYADGKENTFRWSFICPEETIFSQESFTCMRREDMTIDCEESFQYYELNRNFGMVDEDPNKHNNNYNNNHNNNNNIAIVANEDQEPAMSSQIHQQQELQQSVIVPVEEEKTEITAAPATTHVQPMKQKEKPIKVKKPIRRKPAFTFSTQNHPAAHPLRKIPPAIETTAETSQLLEVAPAEKEEVKPFVQKFGKRPATPSTNTQGKVQPPVETTAESTQLLEVTPAEKEEVKPFVQKFGKRPATPSTNTQGKVQPPVETTAESTQLLEVTPAEKEEVKPFVQKFGKRPATPSTNTQGKVQPPVETTAESTQLLEVTPAEKEEVKPFVQKFGKRPATPSTNTQGKVQPPVETTAESTQLLEVTPAEKEEVKPFVQKFGKRPATPSTNTQGKVQPPVETTAESTQLLEVTPAEKEEVKPFVQKYGKRPTTPSTQGKVQPPVETTAESTQLLEVTPAEKEEVKPFVQKYGKRPTTPSTQGKVQPPNTEIIPIRIELYNQKRKHPAYFNKKHAVTDKPIEVIAPDEAQLQLIEPQPNVNLESLLTSGSVSTQESSQSVQSEGTSNANTLKTDAVITLADSESQSSEFAAVSVKPDPSKTTADQSVAGADTHLPDNTLKNVSESVSHTSEVENSPILISEGSKVEESTTPIEEIPAVVAEIEDIKEIANENQPAKIETPPTVEESKLADAEEANPNIDDVVVAEKAQAAEAEPVIIDQNSETDEVNVDPILDELSSSKPANVADIISTSGEIQQQDQMVPQISEERDVQKPSMGGFKPVDPAMAAEAEALINDFLNTLMKTDATNAQSAMPMDMADTVIDLQEAEVEKEEIKKPETQLPIEAEGEEDKIESTADTVTSDIQSAPIDVVEEIIEPHILENAAPISNNLFHNSLPAEMYRIPVKIIETPIEEIPISEQIKGTPKDVQSNEEATKRHHFSPLSVDDVVELVKERLDQAPPVKAETVSETTGEKHTEEQIADNDTVTKEPAVNNVSPSEQQSEEVIIMPIYERASSPVDLTVVEPNKVLINGASKVELQSTASDAAENAETETQSVQLVNAAEVATQTQADAQPTSESSTNQEKSNRAYRSRSMRNTKMDPRKRRFLFKADAS